ncbi:MAG: ribonuclease D [Cytophagaceae bacterium]|nr:ribonuclease D [Gemmatimonadaceae bacterium]
MPTSRALYLDSPDEADRYLSDISGARTIAVDTEGASYHRFVDRIYLLQLSTATHHAIIDPLRVPGLARLGALLEDPAVEVVFHDADYDLRLLHQDYGWRVTNMFDTRVAAQLLGIKAFGLAALLEQNFGVKLDKKHQRADWSMRPLPADMLDYAAQDTLHLIDLSERMRVALEKKGRWHWAQEEFKRLEGTQWDAEDAQTGFLRLKGARDLTRRELARLRELVTWRDDVARGQDRSTFRVMTNEALLDLSRRNPERQADLASIKGLNGRLVEQRGHDILEALTRGNAVTDADLPRFPKSARWDRDPDFDDKVSRLKTVRDAAAARLELDPGVLCARERLESVVRRKPVKVEDLADIKELRQWQVEELGEEFVKALRDTRAAARPPATHDSPYRDA